MHAMQIGLVRGLLWHSLHLPFHIALIILGAAMGIDIRFEKDLKNATLNSTSGIDSHVQWVFVVSMSGVLFLITFIGISFIFLFIFLSICSIIT